MKMRMCLLMNTAKAVLRLLLICALAEPPGVLFGASYHISPLGDDSAEGTLSNPWRTLDAALRRVIPGDTINLRDGQYADRAQTYRDGSPDAPITITASGGSHPVITGRLSIRGSHYEISRIFFKGDYLELNGDLGEANSNTIQHCVFSGGTQGIYMKQDRNDRHFTNGPSANTIVGNTFSNLLGDGAVVLVGVGNVVATNWIGDTGGRDALRVWGLDQVIRGNTFERILSGTDIGTTFHSDILQSFDSPNNPQVVSKGLVFEGNKIIDCTGQFGNVTAVNGSTNIGYWVIRNNLFVNSRIQLNMTVPGFEFYNNTVFNSRYSSGFRFAAGAHEGVVMNNIFCRVGSGVKGSGFYSSVPGNRNFRADYNLITDVDDSAHIAPLEGKGGINGGFAPEEIFIDSEGGNFRLRGGSPAVWSAANLFPLFQLDFLGKSRGSSGAWSIGAFDMHVSEVPRRPSGLTVK